MGAHSSPDIVNDPGLQFLTKLMAHKAIDTILRFREAVHGLPAERRREQKIAVLERRQGLEDLDCFGSQRHCMRCIRLPAVWRDDPLSDLEVKFGPSRFCDLGFSLARINE